jgi:hypothetical protein
LCESLLFELRITLSGCRSSIVPCALRRQVAGASAINFFFGGTSCDTLYRSFHARFDAKWREQAPSISILAEPPVTLCVRDSWRKR